MVATTPGRRSRGRSALLTRLWDRGGLLWAPLVIYTLFTLLPFYSLVELSLHQGGGTTGTFNFLPLPFTWSHFVDVVTQDGFGLYVRNSMIVALGTAVLDIPIAVLTGYALSRYRFAGRQAFMLILLMTQFIPGALMIIPLFITFKVLGLLNTFIGLIVVNATFQLPLTAIMMSGFIGSIPWELEEAAMVDGCTRLGGVVRIVVPLLRPAIVAVGSFAFVGAWDNFLFALFLVNDQNLYTVPVGLSYFLGEYNVDFAALAAGAVIAIIPVVLVFALIQRYLVGGLSAGAVKG
ncbi:MAG: carbohydrate ABC transporter permease [Candidatus Dormibacteraceae bacterium]